MTDRPAPEDTQPDNARIAAVTPQEIAEQREKGWPDFHPEKFCHLCGRLNLRSWFVESSLWNAAGIEDEQHRRGFRRSGIACPQCFERLLEAAGGGHCTWELRADLDTTHHLREDLSAASSEERGAAWRGSGQMRRRVLLVPSPEPSGDT